MKLIFLDTETTGVNPHQNAILQISGTIRINGRIRDTFDIKMQPHSNAAIDFNADMAGSHRTLPEDGFQEFETMLKRHVNPYDKKDKLTFIAYNAKFDEDFVRAWFSRNNHRYYGSYFWNPAFDVMQLAMWHLTKTNARHLLENMKLGTVAKHYGIPVDDSELHDALYDAKILRALYNKLVKTLKRG